MASAPRAQHPPLTPHMCAGFADVLWKTVAWDSGAVPTSYAKRLAPAHRVLFRADPSEKEE